MSTSVPFGSQYCTFYSTSFRLLDNCSFKLELNLNAALVPRVLQGTQYWCVFVYVISLPTSNSNPLFSKVCVQPPAWSCCSRTTTLFPALDKSAAAVKPPMPLPITTTSRAGGTRSTRKPVQNHLYTKECGLRRNLHFVQCRLTAVEIWLKILFE